MMNKDSYSILIVDDHPLIVEAYLNAIRSSNLAEILDKSILTTTAGDLDEGLQKIELLEGNQSIDLAILDLSLPKSADRELLSGEDLAIKVRERIPTAKIIISTMFNDNYRIHSLFRSVDPDGFLVKNDINPTELITAIETVVSDPPYYSSHVVQLLRKQVSNNLLLDDIDRRLLYELSIGTKMKELPKLLPLSLAGIEKRKRLIKETFKVTGKSDKTLFQVAKDKGFL